MSLVSKVAQGTWNVLFIGLNYDYKRGLILFHSFNRPVLHLIHGGILMSEIMKVVIAKLCEANLKYILPIAIYKTRHGLGP